MRHFQGDSADVVWREAVSELFENPQHHHAGRNGNTREILPCIIRLTDPRRRWILSRSPAYNPALGIVEFFWIITGNNESCVPKYWNPGLPKYAGSGDVFHGAYGYRLRQEFGVDQIKRAFEVLTNTPETRQAVLQIWKPDLDLPEITGKPVSKDIPCNMLSLLKVREGRLHWTQIMRSNDAIRGLPVNIIQFTLLQEVMAGWLGCELGEYFHLSDSLHIYETDAEKFKIEESVSQKSRTNYFTLSYEESASLFQSIYDDLKRVSSGRMSEEKLLEIFHPQSGTNEGRCDLIQDLLTVVGSDAARRHGFLRLSHTFAEICNDTDLRNAALNWLNRKEVKR